MFVPLLDLSTLEENWNEPIVVCTVGFSVLFIVIGCLTLETPTVSSANRKSFFVFCKSAILSFSIGFVFGPGSTEPKSLSLSALLGHDLCLFKFSVSFSICYNKVYLSEF